MWPLLLSACSILAQGPEPRDTDTVGASNQTPSAPAVAIAPPQPLAGIDDLRCDIVADAVDPDGDPVTYTTTWTRDGQPWQGTSVPASTTAVDEIWTCTVIPNDGHDDGEPGDDSVTVSAFDPSVTDPYVQPLVYVTPNQPVPGDTATVHYAGDLASSTSVEMVYAFNGWSVLPDMTGYALEAGEGAEQYAYFTVDMTHDGKAWTAAIDLPVDARAIHLQFRTPDGIDDRAGLDYHWAIVAPYIGPYLTWNDDAGPSDGVVVSFVTSIPCLGAVEWSTDAGPDTWTFGEAFGTDHHIAVTGLQPDTTYTYRVHDSSSRPSPTYAFTTAPVDTDSVTFAALADVQDSGHDDDRWDEVATDLWAHHPDLAFVMVTGDLAADDEPGRWWLFFDRARELFGTVVMLPAVGNHDTPTLDSHPDTTSFERYFDLPTTSGAETHYAQRWGPLLVLSPSCCTLIQSRSSGVPSFPQIRAEHARGAGGCASPRMPFGSRSMLWPQG